jgi:hypothetical protein
VTRKATSPGELLLDGIAARILCSGPSFPQDDLRAFIGDGPGDIVAALHASDALPPASPVPGQLAALCTRIGIPRHGITAPPAATRIRTASGGNPAVQPMLRWPRWSSLPSRARGDLLGHQQP